MPDVLVEVTGALQLVPRDFAMLVAFNTVNGAGKTPGPHRVTSGGIARCLSGKSSIETTSITTGFLRVFRAKKPPLHRRETSIEKDEPKYTKLKDLPAASSPKMK